MYSFVGLFAMNTQTGLTVMLGIDRFLAVSAPYKYRKWNSFHYILAMIIPPNIYAFIVTGYGFTEANDNIKVRIDNKRCPRYFEISRAPQVFFKIPLKFICNTVLQLLLSFFCF